MFTEVLIRDDACASLLSEIDFKWLMIGQGRWVDLPRFRCDAAYAVELIDLALDSPSLALRECAALLQTRSRT